MGERVFERGSVGEEVFFVVEGALNVVSFSPVGQEVTFATAPAGATVGEFAAIDGLPRSASVVAIEDSLVAVLDAPSFVALIKADGMVAFELLCRLSAMVRRGDERVVEIGNRQATSRVYGELLRLAQTDQTAPDLWVVKPLPPLRDLAGTAGTTREIVSGALRQLYPSGIIRRKCDTLYILDRAALEDIVSPPDSERAGG
jgi:CRP-like cAMP-binding protein